jgi:hypothetical protein
MLDALIICSGIVLVLLVLLYNLFKKYEKLEEIIENQASFITDLKSELELIELKIKEIDDKGTFKSDDEIGWFFTQLKSLADRLKVFI